LTFRQRIRIEETPRLVSYPLLGDVKTGTNISALLDGGYTRHFTTAPIDLKSGDICTINLNNGEIIEVKRGESIIYTPPPK
jgi:hypothetical protein